MSKKPETLLVDKIMLWLKAGGGLWVKIHGGPFQEAGISDIIGCYEGHFVAIEVKVGTNTATDLQLIFLKHVKESGGRYGVAYSLEEALKIRDGGNV